MGLKNKHKGSIETEISWNDLAQTEVLYEQFTFHDLEVTLFHGLESEEPSINVEVQSTAYEGLSVYITRGSDKFLFAHEYGDFQATAKEIEEALSLARAVRQIGKVLNGRH